MEIILGKTCKSFTDIIVPRSEMQSALKEAGVPLSGARDIRHELNATDVLTLKEKLSL